ncbi:MAG: SUMF1/EgtB/PvdO family nonheme iron enzyme [Bryobacterales bacterium]|nr:SUMF1/EgtB/PvdO family nonheme iron enzyme [Bryobacterales bacterium]
MSKKSAEWLVHYLGHHASKWDLTPEFFQDRLNRPETLLLIDGLDEATNDQQRALFARMFEEVTSDYACRMVVTTRPKAYENQSVLHGFERTEVEDLDPEAVERFLRHWSAGLHRKSPTKAAELYSELSGALAARPEIRHMARNPLMLTALAVVQHNDNRLPEQRAELYESIVKWLARQREGSRVDRKPEECLDLFGRLALRMQQHQDGRLVDVGRGQAADWIAPRLKGENPKQQALDFLAQEEVNSAIITSTGSRIRYWHLTFQEYLAARAIAGLEDGDQHQLFQENRRLYRPEWREVMRLLAGTLMSRQGVEKVEALFRAVLNTADQQPLKRKAECVGLLGSILADLRPTHYVPADPRFEPLLKEVMAIFEPSFTSGVNLKVEAAEAIGRFGDPRLEQDNRVWIPGGTFWMGAQRKAKSKPNYDREARAHEGPVHRVTLKGFHIGKYRVTVAEYAKFLDSNPSHQPEDWDTQLLRPNRPVVLVSWHNADAYCQWAGGHLPTEAQWEFAARGTNSRRYPWGDTDPSPEHANFDGTGLESKEPTPVGLFPNGASEHNVMDMAGNVWEWVADWYGSYKQDEQENPTGPKKGEYRVVRGGAYRYEAANLRSACRDGDHPVGWGSSIGFRCTWE